MTLTFSYRAPQSLCLVFGLNDGFLYRILYCSPVHNWMDWMTIQSSACLTFKLKLHHVDLGRLLRTKIHTWRPSNVVYLSHNSQCGIHSQPNSYGGALWWMDTYFAASIIILSLGSTSKKREPSSKGARDKTRNLRSLRRRRAKTPPKT